MIIRALRRGVGLGLQLGLQLGLGLVVAAPPLAAQEPWPAELYDPGAAQGQSADLLLPLPCGGQMAFQKVVVPVAADAPLDDRRLRLGQSQPETGYADYLHVEHLRGAFSAAGESYYYMARYEMTRAQARALRGDCAAPARADRIAEAGLSWFSAVDLSRAYSEWLLGPGRAGLPAELGPQPYLRLPTEAEWEYATRGGAAIESTLFPARRFFASGDLGEYAMYQGAGSARGQVLPVGLRAPNPLGLYDVYGNAEELMLEPFRLNVLGRAHGQAGGLVTRGGSVLSVPDEIYSAQRREYPLFAPESGKALEGATFGLRLVLTRPVLENDAELRAIREAWLGLAERPEDSGADPIAALAGMIEDEPDPRRQTALSDLQHAIRQARDQADAALRDQAKSALLSGTVFIGAMRSLSQDITAKTENMRKLADEIRLRSDADRAPLVAAGQQLSAERGRMQQLQRSYLQSYRGALEALTTTLDPAMVEAAFGLLQQDLSQAGQSGLIGDLQDFNRDLAQYAARPDMTEIDLLMLALAD